MLINHVKIPHYLFSEVFLLKNKFGNVVFLFHICNMINKELKKLLNELGFKKVGGKPELNAHYRFYDNNYMDFCDDDQPYFGREITTIIDNCDDKTCDIYIETDLDFIHEDQPEDTDIEIEKVEYKDILSILEQRTLHFSLLKEAA